ncbi:MAG: DUF2336 domain-containing protein, partial [Pseudomonadota bacterium]|nr:DUF2336 domain-containing protein [Pseudomonadota bacterium]
MPPASGGDLYNDEQIDDLVDQLFTGGRLTHSLLMRALCMGNLGLFEAGVARLARVPRVNARILMMDAGSLGFESLYKTAGMPEGFMEAVKVLLRTSLEESDYGSARNTDCRKRVIDRIYEEGHYHRVENLQYLLAIIGGKIGSHANVN